jgi:hypothetical protein
VLKCVVSETVSCMQTACNDGGRETPGKRQERSPILADGKDGKKVISLRGMLILL